MCLAVFLKIVSLNKYYLEVVYHVFTRNTVNRVKTWHGRQKSPSETKNVCQKIYLTFEITLLRPTYTVFQNLFWKV